MSAMSLATVELELEPEPPMPHVLQSVASRLLALVKRRTPKGREREREREREGERGLV
jgi:hypothetical protein